MALTPGALLTPTEVVGLAAAFGALWAWSQRRERLTAGALALAVLARETMLLRDRGPETLFCAGQTAVVVLLGEVFWIDHRTFCTRVTAPLFASLVPAGVSARRRAAIAVLARRSH